MLTVDVYVTPNGFVHHLPPDLVAEAKKINGAKKISDRRTKGERLLRQWAEAKDAEELGLPKE